MTLFTVFSWHGGMCLKFLYFRDGSRRIRNLRSSYVTLRPSRQVWTISDPVSKQNKTENKEQQNRLRDEKVLAVPLEFWSLVPSTHMWWITMAPTPGDLVTSSDLCAGICTCLCMRTHIQKNKSFKKNSVHSFKS